MYTSEVLLAVNNSPAVYRGYCEPNFTMRVKDLNTVGKAITLDSAQFELRFQNIGKNNKIFVVKGKVTSDVEIQPGSYTDVGHLMKTINAALAKSGHDDVTFDYIRVQSKVVITVPADKILRLTKDSPSLLLGLGEIRGDVVYDVGDQKAATAKILPYAVDLSVGRRAVLLYSDLIYPAVEYEDNADSRVIKTFVIQSLNGINNYVFAKEDFRQMIPHNQVTDISFWLRYNTGEYIESGYPLFLDLRIIKL